MDELAYLILGILVIVIAVIILAFRVGIRDCD